MKTVSLNEKPLYPLPDVGGCSNSGGIVLAGPTLYTIKTKRNDSMSAISRYPTYTKNERKSHKFEGIMNHGNDLTYRSAQVYVAPCGWYVVKVDVKTWTYKRIPADTYVSAISHYKGPYFFALTSNRRASYTISIIREDEDRFRLVRSWDVSNPLAGEGFTKSQGMAFKKTSKQLYMIFSNEGVTSNIILRSGVDKTAPNCVFKSKRSSNGLYELEGLTFTPTGSMLLNFNLPSGDGLYKAR